MYDELVKRLREKSGAFDYDGRPDIACDYEQAADAIEELSRDLDSMNEANIALYGALPRWIPVSERLPEAYKPILLYNDEGIATGYMHSDKRFTVNGSHFPSRPTHWMPLPEPPKEE